MATGQDVLDIICYDIFEDGGLQLGLLTTTQFLDLLNLTLADFYKSIAAYQQINTLSVFAGTAQYQYPDSQMRVDYAFLAGRWLEPSSAQQLRNANRSRVRIDQPRAYHLDELPLQTVELSPVPNDSSVFITGPNEPAPPHGQIGGFNVIVESATLTPDQHRGLTLIGPQFPPPLADLTTPIALLPDDFALAYLPAGVLARIASSDSELNNPTLAEWAEAQCQEGVAILQSASGEEGGLSG